jgi:hypothetical protein
MPARDHLDAADRGAVARRGAWRANERRQCADLRDQPLTFAPPLQESPRLRTSDAVVYGVALYQGIKRHHGPIEPMLGARRLLERASFDVATREQCRSAKADDCSV